MPFTPEELAEMAAADAEIEANFTLTPEERMLSAALDREARPYRGQSAYYAAHRSELIEAAKARQRQDPERTAEVHRAWYQKNKDRVRAYQREYFRRNADAIRQRNSDYYYANRETILAKAKARRDAKRAAASA